MSTIQSIPLNKLKVSTWNVRKTGGKDVADLAASIKSLGLLQNLTVNAGDNGTFYVINGGRRLAALLDLWRAGHIVADFPVPCRVVDPAETDLVEASLAENVVREAMHPADQFEAFRKLAGDGEDVADIAARFGVSEAVVRQRLKLANVCPVILDEYRAGNATLEQMQALAISDDHDAQLDAWGESGGWHRDPRNLRDALTKAEIPSTHARAKFVGVEAYEAAGGVVKRDLFGDKHYLTDSALLDRLVAEKLAVVAEEVKAHGWAWVDTFPTMDQAQRNAYRSAGNPSRRDMTAEEKAEHDALDALTDQLGDQMENAEGEEYDRLDAERDRHLERMEEIQEARFYWPDEIKATAGVLVYLDHTGLNIEPGKLRPGQKAGHDSVEVSSHTRAAPGKAVKDPGTLPQKSLERLWGERTAILRMQVSDRAALAALAASLSQRIHLRNTPPVCIGTGHTYVPPAMGEALEAHPCSTQMKEEVEAWRKRLAPAKGDVFGWLLKQDDQVTLDLLAFCSAQAIITQDDGAAFAYQAGVDIAEHWAVTEEWLAAQPKAYILAALREVKAKTDGLDKLKVAELAAKAAPVLQAKNWLPEPLRAPKARKPDAKQKAANDRGDDE